MPNNEVAYTHMNTAHHRADYIKKGRSTHRTTATLGRLRATPTTNRRFTHE